ncbi:hypothetical protein COZ97_02365 [bacterium CG_4_8_14_3_um_filter_33_28]|nr:MAG: hypothetical protein COU50_00925 [bacterium CG10_big_fil_rev_8_21_14_0_10_33_18]PIW81321.1 MAG: hypothetical protein COZ97_02365 [bacterium CG_4_8_14_3_um_filter_33_28]PJA72244.1 MAG: hypothetical protein CO152_02460 [bacterium CG_4_9_14_3_um_filter_33_26]
MFDEKQAIYVEKFCRDFYKNQILNTNIKGVDIDAIYPEYTKKALTEADPVFTNVDKQKLAAELKILQFELFALAWIHKFGHEFAIVQSIFTRQYLHDEGRDDVWDGMAYYNRAIAHATTVGLSSIDSAAILLGRKNFADLYIEKAEKSGVNMKDKSEAESRSLPICRLFSEKAWGKGSTTYFLILSLCHRVGLGFGPDYLGPNEEAQFCLSKLIHDLYDDAYQALEKIKINN